jgi:hypothetical protein
MQCQCEHLHELGTVWDDSDPIMLDVVVLPGKEEVFEGAEMGLTYRSERPRVPSVGIAWQDTTTILWRPECGK